MAVKLYCLLAILILSTAAFAGTVTFQSSEVDLGQGAGTGLYGALTNQWAAFNISGDGNAQVYNDPHDTFDGNGITDFTDPTLITFLSPVDFLTVDYVILAGHSITLSALDASSNVLETFTDSEASAFDGSHFFNFTGIQTLSYSADTTDQTGVSDLIWRSESDPPPVPEPATAWLIGFGVAGVVLCRKSFLKASV
jgi:hypothetical protein